MTYYTYKCIRNPGWQLYVSKYLYVFEKSFCSFCKCPSEYIDFKWASKRPCECIISITKSYKCELALASLIRQKTLEQKQKPKKIKQKTMSKTHLNMCKCICENGNPFELLAAATQPKLSTQFWIICKRILGCKVECQLFSHRTTPHIHTFVLWKLFAVEWIFMLSRCHFAHWHCETCHHGALNVCARAHVPHVYKCGIHIRQEFMSCSGEKCGLIEGVCAAHAVNGFSHPIQHFKIA